MDYDQVERLINSFNRIGAALEKLGDNTKKTDQSFHTYISQPHTKESTDE